MENQTTFTPAQCTCQIQFGADGVVTSTILCEQHANVQEEVIMEVIKEEQVVIQAEEEQLQAENLMQEILEEPIQE
jgi:hypothetical protein